MTNSEDDTKDEKNENEDEADLESSIHLALKEGQVTGLPNDPASAPVEIRLNRKIHERGNETVEQTKQSGNEWGFFIHFDETGRLIPGEVRRPSEEASKAGSGWIALEEYLEIKKQDETIHGHLHTHPKSRKYPGGELTFSEGNIGIFLEVEDVIFMCKGPQGDYLIALRTQQTPSSRKGISKKAIAEYRKILPKQLAAVLDEGLEGKPAITKAVLKAMLEVCKNYNIAVYKGRRAKPAMKVEDDV